MSSSKQIIPISTQLIFGTKIHSKNLTYNDLINYISLRKQFSRLIPQYLNYQNKKYIKNRNFTSNIEVFRKLKQEIISMEESISSLKEKKQKKLEEIEQLRCLMRKVGNKQNNNYNKGTNNYTMSYAQKREVKICLQEKMMNKLQKEEIIKEMNKVILILLFVMAIVVVVIKMNGIVALKVRKVLVILLNAYKRKIVFYMEKIIKEIINDPELNNYNENEKTFLFNFIIIINNYFVNITYKYYKYDDINFFSLISLFIFIS